MVGIVLCSIMLFLTFGTAVCCVQTVKHCTAEEAVAVCTRAIKKWTIWLGKELFGKSTAPVEYPTYMGWDGTKFINSAIEKEFAEVCELFKFCRCTKKAMNEMFYGYYFSVVLTSDAEQDKEKFEELLQKVAEKCLDDHLERNGCSCEASDLISAELHSDHIEIYCARNDEGVKILAERREKRYSAKVEKQRKEQIGCVLEENWGETKENQMIWGYDGKTSHRYRIKLPIKTELDSHTHTLITGSSGSGKSVALLFLLGKRMQSDPGAQVYVCDYKNSADFRFLDEYTRYYTGDRCYEGIMEFYRKFQETRESGEPEGRYLLIFDEYPAFLNHLQMLDKQNKTKQAVEVMSAVSEILMLGRGLRYGIWIVTQRADASLFANGSRDNFMSVLALGKMSREQKNMLFTGEELPDRTYQPGEGVILLDGRGIEEVKIPRITDVPEWKSGILAALERSDGGNAGRES